MTPFEIGYDAFLKGAKKEDCPFDTDTCPWSAKRWLQGWNKALMNRREKA